MTITTLDGMFNALANNSSRLVIDKGTISNTTAGQLYSLWRATGQPGQGAIPTTIATCNNTTLGGFNFTQQTSPSTSYIGYLEILCPLSSVTFEMHDRLMHMGGLNGSLATEQTVNLDLNGVTADNMVERIGDANYSDVQWWLEWYVSTGSPGVTATVGVTYNDGTTGNLTGFVVGTTTRASFMQGLNGFIPATDSGKYIRAVNSVTLSAPTSTVGNFGVTATRLRASLLCPSANMKWSADWAALPVSEIPNSSCLFLAQVAGSTSTGTVRGGGKIAHG